MFVYLQPLQTTGAYAVLQPHPPLEGQFPASVGRANSWNAPRHSTNRATTKMGHCARFIVRLLWWQIETRS
jgi:hypothetical protein